MKRNLMNELKEGMDALTEDRHMTKNQQLEEAQSEVRRLKARIETQEGISRDLLLQRGDLLAELNVLKDQSGDATEMIKPAPSRLEIAAMFKAAWFANSGYNAVDACDDGWWIEQADNLIEANKKII
jgi:hypothetical protein